MAVTEIEQLLVDYLSLSRASEGGQALAFIALDTEDQMLKMCRFLSDNEMATEEQIIAQARKIAQTEQEVLSKC